MAVVKKPRKRKRKRHYITGSYVSARSGQTFKYRSGWELKYMEHLDVNPDVVSWSYESFFIEYLSNVKTGRMRKYTPDFKVEYKDGHIEIIEVKPVSRLKNVKVVKKIAAARNWCHINNVQFKIITEVELKNL